MCGYSMTERGSRSYVEDYLAAAKRREEKGDTGMANYYMDQARSVLHRAQVQGWLLELDPVTCVKKVAPKPVHRKGMKVVREALKEADKLPAPAEKREKATA